ncbi:hypothetical protein CGCSCA1_v006804 [Colletotrichum siamense]|nr:hypothetical protein CGCSCA1_v006804 [Colletotrichum siamense]
MHATSHEHRDSAASTVLHESAYGSDKKASVIHVHPQFPTEEYHHTTRQPSTGYKLVSAWWSLELASTAICVGFFATYWWLLEHYDDKPRCQWKDVTTIAVDYQCANASAVINAEGFAFSSQANITNRVSVPSFNGAFAHAQIRLKPSLTIPNSSVFTSTYSNSPGLILHLAAIAERGDGEFEAAECVFSWEVATWGFNTYNVTSLSFDQGSNTDYHNVTPNPATNRDKDIIIHAPCNTGHNITSEEDPGGMKCSYTVTNHAHEGLRNFLANALRGFTYRENSKTHTIFRSDNTIFNIFRSSWQLSFKDPGAQTALNTTMVIYARQIASGIGAAA